MAVRSAVVDHFSRRAVGFAVFPKRPTATNVTAFLSRAVQMTGTKPKYIVTDKGRQFRCATFKWWCRRRRIRPRFGAVGKHGSIAIVERLIRSMKSECCRRIEIPTRLESLREELSLYVG